MGVKPRTWMPLPQVLEAEDDPGLGGVVGGHVQEPGLDVQRPRLLHDLQRRLGIGEGVEVDRLLRARLVDLAALGPQLVRLVREGLAVGPPAGLVVDGHVGAEEAHQQVVALHLLVVDAAHRPQDQVQLEAQAGAGGRHLPAVVGLHGGAGDDHLGALLQGVGQGELEHARLVAAEGQARQVVALDEDVGAAELGAEPGHRLQGRGAHRGQPHPGQGRQGGLELALPVGAHAHRPFGQPLAGSFGSFACRWHSSITAI